MVIKGTLQNWAMPKLRDRLSETPGAIGRCVVHGINGQTTRIVAVCPRTHTVTTESGSVYALGTPNLGFAVAHPGILQQLGLCELSEQ